MSRLDLHHFWTVSENHSCIWLAKTDHQSLHSKKIEEINIIVSYLIGRENVPVFFIQKHVSHCKSFKQILPLCFYINQALFLPLYIPDFAQFHVILLYNLKNHLMNEDSCKECLQRNNLQHLAQTYPQKNSNILIKI